MDNQNKMRLCGGTFLVLLFEAKGQRRVSRAGNGRPSDKKSNPEIFGSLVKFANPDFVMPEGRTFGTFTSDYKLCRKSDSPAAMLTDSTIVHNFDQRMRTDYYTNARYFYRILENSISWGVKGQWLVAALLDLIKADATISDDAEFYVRIYGETVTKKELKNIKCICTPSFVLGVWHYIITHISDNAVGLPTIGEFLESNTEHRAERKFISDIGQKTALAITTSVDTPEDELKNFKYPPELEKLLNKDGMAYIMPGGMAGVSNIKNGQIFVSGKQVVTTDDLNQQTEIFHTPFVTYLERAIKYYSNIKTMLYLEKPRLFKDFYVCNDLRMRITGSGQNDIPNISMGVLSNISRNFIISGTGGIGKSMMMRHLFFEAAENYNTYELLPILSPLKNFTTEDTDIARFLYKTVQEYDPDIEFKKLDSDLKSGRCLILFDGLDEIPSNARENFENAIVRFLKSCSDNHVVLSSRPTTQFIQFGHFPVMEILPFSKEKALKLIDKLEYHDAEAKVKFRGDLDEKLYRSHQQFASNPLLLTIMLMTYTAYGEIPAKRHIFYAKAYETMARLHDASKGAYVRPMHTKLSPEEFATYFAEFCARTYRAEVLEFSEQLFTQYMTKVIRHIGKNLTATPRDFLQDLTDNLCIMYKEGECYYFIHRSFQEYFSAVYFSNQMDDKLSKIGEFFENQRHRQIGDKTFDMLYDMIPDRIDKYVFLPYLNELWRHCDNENGYWTFLDEMYPVIYSYSGTPGDYTENNPQSYLYNFLVNESLHRNNELYNIQWPSSISYCNQTEWTSLMKGYYIGSDGKQYCRSETVEMDSVDVDDAYIEEYGEPEVEGVTWEIDVNDIRHSKKYCSDLVAFIEDDSFLLKIEYNEMRKLTDNMNKRINNKPSSDDWFDDF